jgi:hypothetical protein
MASTNPRWTTHFNKLLESWLYSITNTYQNHVDNTYPTETTILVVVGECLQPDK